MKTDIEKLKSDLVKIIQEGKELSKDLTDPKAWDSITEVTDNITEITAFALYVVTAAEEIVSNLNSDIKSIKSEEKRQAVIDAIDEAIVLPWYAESFDNYVIEMAIDKAVDFLNKKFGKEWDLDEVKIYLEKLKGDIKK